jgi:CheY-like chemotaxis protein
MNSSPSIAGGAEIGGSGGQPLRVLVVDDDREASSSIARALEHLGHRPTACAHAEDALNLTLSQPFDVLLIDYRMPDMTGLDLIAMLRAENCQVPMVMMTGHFATEDRVPIDGMDVSIILRKPITLPQLQNALAQALAEGGGA